MVKRLNEMQGSPQLDRLGRLLDNLRDVDGTQDYVNENLNALYFFYDNMYAMNRATSSKEVIEFYDRVEPIIVSLMQAMEDFISESNIVLTDKKYRDLLSEWRDSIN